jgi:acetyl-CoA carboxylase carboxyltransferase component
VGCDAKDFALLIFGALVMFVVGLYKEKGHHIREELAGQNIVIRWAVYYVLAFSVVILGAYGSGYDVVGFIYAQF